MTAYLIPVTADGGFLQTPVAGQPAIEFATEEYVGTAIANLVDTAPTTLNTLNELAAALNDDENFASTVTTALGNKANTSSLAAVATSGSYADLSNKPTIPTDVGVSLTSESATSPTYTGDSSSTPWGYPDWEGNPSSTFIAYSASAEFFTVLNALQPGDTVTFNGTVTQTIDHVDTQPYGYQSGDFKIYLTANKQVSDTVTTLAFTVSTSSVLLSGSLKFQDDTVQTTAWTGAVSYNDLTNKPTLFSGSYTDLSDKPTIPTSFTSIVNGSYAVELAMDGTILLPRSASTTTTWTGSGGDYPAYAGFNQQGATFLGSGSTTGSIGIKLTDPTKIATWQALPAGTEVTVSGTGYMPFGAITVTLSGVSGTSGSYYTQEIQSYTGLIYQGDGAAYFDSVEFSVAGTRFVLTPSTLTFPDDTQQTTAWTGTVSYNDLTNKPTIPVDVSDLTDTGNLLISTSATTVSWSSVDSGNVTFYADQNISQITISQVSSSSNGTSLDLYNALAGGTFVSGTSGTLVESGNNTIEFVLTSGFTYDQNAAGGGGGWIANATATSGTPTATMGSSAVFITGGISYNDLTNKPTPLVELTGMQYLAHEGAGLTPLPQEGVTGGTLYIANGISYSGTDPTTVAVPNGTYSGQRFTIMNVTGSVVTIEVSGPVTLTTLQPGDAVNMVFVGSITGSISSSGQNKWYITSKYVA